MDLTAFTGCGKKGSAGTGGNLTKETKSSATVTTIFACSGTHVSSTHNKVAIAVTNGKTFSIDTTKTNLYCIWMGLIIAK